MMNGTIRVVMRRALFVAALVLPGWCAFAQTITRFAVVDTTRVYQAFYRDSSSVRNYEGKKAEFQAEIDRLTKELQALHNQKVQYDSSGNSEESRRVQVQITQKTSYLSEYTSARNEELESMRRTMQNNDAFYKRLYSVLESVAESEGYSMVLSLQQANAVLWYSPSVDLTDRVIRELGLKNN